MSTGDPWLWQNIYQGYNNVYSSASPLTFLSNSSQTFKSQSFTTSGIVSNGSTPITYYGIPDTNVSSTAFTYDCKPLLINLLNIKFDGFTFYLNKAGTVSIDNGTDRVIRTDIELVSEYYTKTEYFDILVEEIKELIAE